MSDKSLLEHIDELVEQEKQLRANHAGLSEDDRAKLAAIEVELDRLWDLLRQRRARAEAGQDPEQSEERPAGEVESYLQ